MSSGQVNRRKVDVDRVAELQPGHAPEAPDGWRIHVDAKDVVAITGNAPPAAVMRQPWMSHVCEIMCRDDVSVAIEHLRAYVERGDLTPRCRVLNDHGEIRVLCAVLRARIEWPLDD